MTDKTRPYCLIVDDDRSAAGRLVSLMKQVNVPWDVEASFYTDEVLRRCTIRKPDYLFLEVEMPLMSGFELLDKVRLQGCQPQVVFVTAFEHYAIKAIRAGAFDYLLKPIDVEELKLVVNKLFDRSSSWDRKLSLSEISARLSDREMDVARLLLTGIKSDEIARKLNLSPHTVNTHKKSIFNKTGIHSISEFIARYIN